MTHLPFIVATYVLAVAVLVGFGVGAWVRAGRATRRLAAIDPRQARR
jgi:type IV secretory pathway TrbD component